MTPLYVAYYRVSTEKQGRSGLGLSAQQEAVERYVRSVGGNIEVSFTEIESGKRNDRPELKKALAFARMTGAALVIAKLDRLARNVAFISSLMESKVEFVAVDMPYANKLTIHILAAMAEYEREAISRRTKDALAAAKRRGILLGKNNLTADGQAKGAAAAADVRRKKADKRSAELYEYIRTEVESGGSYEHIARLLNSTALKTPGGKQKQWQATTVKRVVERTAPAEAEKRKRRKQI